MSFPAALALAATRVQTRLDHALSDRADEPVIHAMRYAMLGGKRLRGFLVLESAAMLGVAPDAAVSAAAALHCEHCLEAHMARAVAEGATLDEIMDTLLVAGSIAESSSYSVSFRKFKQLEGKIKKSGAGKE